MGTSGSTWRIIEHSGLAGLAEVEADWRRLACEMPDPAPWHLYDAFAAYARELCPDPGKLRLLALAEDDVVRAILPIEERVDRSLGVPLRVWGQCWSHNWRPSDAIGPEDVARTRLVPAALDHLRQLGDRPAIFEVGSTHADSAMWCQGLPGAFVFGDGFESRFDTDVDFVEFTNRMSKSARKRIAAKLRHLQREGDVRFERARRPEELEAAFAQLLRLEVSGWKGDNGTAISQHEHFVRFYREVVSGVWDGGRCEIHTLYLDDVCVAASLCVYSRHGAGGIKSGFDEAYRHFAPGILLAHKTFEWACEDPETRWFSGMGEALWAHRWMPERRVLNRSYVALRPFGSVLVSLMRLRYGPVRTHVRALAKKRESGSPATSPESA